jgi:peroxiredoxin Q/BCP
MHLLSFAKFCLIDFLTISGEKIMACIQHILKIILIGLFLIGTLACDSGTDNTVELEVGDKAPQFSGIDDSGKLWNSKELVGQKIVVVYFYPAAMTGGCTKQACAFRDDRSALMDLGVEVVGVSGDKVENLKYFKMANNLNFTLLADEDGSIAKKFGVILREGGSINRTIEGEEKTLTRGVTASRWTFIIDKEGKIIYKDTQVNAAEDSKNVLTFIKDQMNKN